VEEYFDVVDEDDKVISRAKRKECHSNPELIHRAVHIIILNSKGQILLEKRSMEKDLYPGLWCDIAGHLDSGENYEEAARRELKEETSLETPLKFLFKFRKDAEKETEFISVFSCESEGPFRINPEETQFVKFFDISEIKEMLAEGGSITPGTAGTLRKYLKSGGAA
jgi:isopentenyl-diphosphate delta-isomerase type 1